MDLAEPGVPLESQGLAGWPEVHIGSMCRAVGGRWGRGDVSGLRQPASRPEVVGATLQDVRLLAASKAPQRAAEVERDLDKADGMIRLLFNDVQTLKDGRHPQGEQMYRRWAGALAGGGVFTQPGLSSCRQLPPPTAPRVYRLHERLVAIRTEYNLRLKSGVAAPVTQVTMQTTQRRPELEDATLRYLQDLLAWVEENQRRVDSAEWGGDLPSVEAQLGSHRGLHQSIDEFRAKIERARADEVCVHPGVGSGGGGT